MKGKQQKSRQQRRAAKAAKRKAAKRKMAARRPIAAAPSGRIEQLEEFDNFAHLRNKLRELSQMSDEFAGIPIPIEGERLVIEPSYPFAALGEIGEEEDVEPEPGEPTFTIRNEFYCRRKRCRVIVIEDQHERVRKVVVPAQKIDCELRTIGCSFAWGIEQEHIALQTLGTKIKHVAFKQYLLTGMFLETSERSGITYLFRKLRPTVAISRRGDKLKMLCAMCMHPIGYYRESWAGAMCPTDDVLAHLMLMRGDEPEFWKRSNQHSPWIPEAGL